MDGTTPESRWDNRRARAVQNSLHCRHGYERRGRRICDILLIINDKHLSSFCLGIDIDIQSYSDHIHITVLRVYIYIYICTHYTCFFQEYLFLHTSHFLICFMFFQELETTNEIPSTKQAWHNPPFTMIFLLRPAIGDFPIAVLIGCPLKYQFGLRLIL